MNEFVIPQHFEELEKQGILDLDRVRYRSPKENLRSVKGNSWWIEEGEHAVSELYWLVKTFRDLSNNEKQELVEMMREAVDKAVQLQQLSALKSTGFFVAFLINVAEDLESELVSGKGKGKQNQEWSWTTQGLETALRCLTQITEQKNDMAENKYTENFSSMSWRAALTAMERTSAVKNSALMDLVFRIISVGISRWSQSMPISAALVHLVHRQEHVAPSVATLLIKFNRKPDFKDFVDSTIAELCSSARLSDLNRDTSAGKYLGVVFSTIAIGDAALLAKYSKELVIPLLDHEPYTLRSGVVDALATSTLDQQVMGEYEGLRTEIFDVLFARICDINAFTRSRTIHAWMRLAEAHVVKHSELAELSQQVTDRLHDKAAAVRKSALQLWQVIMEHNPFSPTLSRQMVETAQAKAEASEDSKEQAGLNSYVSVVQNAELAVQRANNLLKSDSVTDVVESINMLSCSRKFQVHGADSAVRSILTLILARDKAVSDAACRCMEENLCQDQNPEASTKDQSTSMLKSLVLLMRNATVGERVCIESCIKRLYASDGHAGSLIKSSTFRKILWDVISGRAGGALSEIRKVACIVLGAVTSASGPEDDPLTVVSSKRIVILTSVAVQHEDPALAREACSLICRIVPRTSPGAEEAALEIVDKVLISSAHDASVPNDVWLPLAEQALNATYALSTQPEKLAAGVIHRVGSRTLQNPAEWAVTRFVFMIGHAAVRQLVFNEERARELSMSSGTETPSRSDRDKKGDEGIEDVVGISLGAEADAAVERGEQELVGEGSVLGKFAPLVAKVATDRNASHVQRAAAAASLAKLMAVHSFMCEHYVRLMFSLLDPSNAPPVVRGNTIVALGDLSFRHPNILEPWSAKMYSSLRDEDALVRRYTLSTLTHLILNDMVKVRGQVVELVLCLKDNDERVQALAKLFFNELSRKGGNLIYNILPDTLSCLSQRTDVERGTYREVMKFLVSFLDKSRHVEGMVDKLCPRFRASDEVQEWRDLSFVLSLLPYQDRALRRLMDNFKTYADKLDDVEVRENFETIAARVKQLPKIDKALGAEFEASIARIANRKEDEDVKDVLHDLDIYGATPKAKSRSQSVSKSTLASTVKASRRKKGVRTLLPLTPTALNLNGEN
uniref:Condensin complex subunit 1 n=1 Tax=Rhodosorus marinus TaxID=101924 RepID=A0A7S3ENE7_9RHOD|mmetsp:Transcript_8272/g.36973  ORF Transcript_8272/g.36973 Transcript_8272/m.36973 type:complete len:1136 (+) Transcript_8272:101-3508(+)